jgi:Coenzyme PQQ synthesis protein D (PqqD)
MTERLRLRPDALEWRRVDDETLVLDGASSTYLALNRTGSVVWSALAEGATREDLVAQLVAAFDVDQARAAADLDALLAELRRLDLLAQP